MQASTLLDDYACALLPNMLHPLWGGSLPVELAEGAHDLAYVRDGLAALR